MKEYWRNISKYKYDNNPEERKRRKDNQKRRENKAQLLREWQRNNPEKIKLYRIRRESHKKHEITIDEWENCKNYFNYRCAYCGITVEEHFVTYGGKLKHTDFHKDHVDHNGANDLSNCVPSCKSCNGSKHTASLEEWYLSNINYKEERYEKVINWLTHDYKDYINI